MLPMIGVLKDLAFSGQHVVVAGGRGCGRACRSDAAVIFGGLLLPER
jgi:hypothetical protein